MECNLAASIDGNDASNPVTVPPKRANDSDKIPPPHPTSNIFKPDNDLEENYWFSLNREDILKFTGKEFSKYIIYLNGNYQVPKPKKITANISNNHQKYALTWFSLAISILLLYLYFRKKNY